MLPVSDEKWGYEIRWNCLRTARDPDSNSKNFPSPSGCKRTTPGVQRVLNSFPNQSVGTVLDGLCSEEFALNRVANSIALLETLVMPCRQRPADL